MKTRMPRTASYDGVTVHTVRLPLWPYLVTPAAASGLWVGTAGAHAMWADTPGWPAAGLTLAGVGLTALTWRAAAARGVVRQTVATLAAGAGSTWTLGAVIAAPWSRPWLDMWLIGAPAASIAMAVLRVLRSGDGHDHDGGTGAGLADAVKSLRGARVGRARVDGARATAPVTLEAGTSAADLAGERDSLASALDVAATAVRVVPDADSARRARVEVVPVDQLREMIPWPGLSAPGGSIAEPVVLGRMEDGEPLRLWLPGDHAAGRNATHVLVVGMSGAGKTELLLTLAAEVLSRADAELWMADPRKGDQLPGWLRTGAARTATAEADVEELLDALPGDIATRARWLGERGHKQWTPAAGRQGLPYRVVIVDEAARVVAGNPLVTELAESARSAGISLILGLQRASHDRLPTSARANIGGSLVLGVRDETDASMALSDTTMDAGAAPWVWGNTRPGYLYAEVPGVEPERWSMPARSYGVDEAERAAAVAPYLPAAEPAQARPSRPSRTGADDDQNDEPNAALDQSEPPDDVDPSQPITIPPGMPRIPLGGLRTPPMGTQEARAWLCQHLEALYDAGVTSIRPSDLSDVIEATGRGGSWLNKELRRMAKSGPDSILEQTDRGVYRIRVPQPV